jgi:putative hydrolase of the HAD superfamily
MLILFDLDDTLLDHSTAMRSAALSLWSRVDTQLAPEQFFDAWRRAQANHYPRYLRGELTYQEQRRARVRDSIDPSIDDIRADALFDFYFSHYQEAWSLFSDTIECLNVLRDHRLGVITNGQSREQRAKLAQTGIVDAFSYVLVSEECGAAKPAAEIFLRACADIGVNPEDAVYVGDRYDLDADAARKAGLRGVWLDRGDIRMPGHLPPIIGNLTELPTSLVSL